MPEYKELLKLLCDTMSIGGFEDHVFSEIKPVLDPLFDEVSIDNAKNIILRKNSQKGGKRKKLMIDAHIDEIGMLVSKVNPDGSLAVAPVGGFDKTILSAADVFVYGRKKIFGVLVPPHEYTGRECDKKNPEIKEFRVDIGMSYEKAVSMVPVSSPIGYACSISELNPDRLTGRSFDDKACAAALICAAANTPADESEYDVYVTLSSGEEIGQGGIKCAAVAIDPDLAIVTDVNFARTPGVGKAESGELGKGPMISLSAVTDRTFTEKIISLAEKNAVPLQKVVESTSTGTNATHLINQNRGIVTAVVSIPLSGMHSYNESLSLRDVAEFIRLISLVIKGVGEK